MVKSMISRRVEARLVLLLALPLNVACASLGSGQAGAAASAPAAPDASAPAAPDASAALPPSEAIPAAEAAQSASATATEIDSLLARARDAEDSNHLSEAIRAYVSVIAIYEEGAAPEAQARAEEAAKALARIGGSLSLEPAGEWVDAKGAQVAGSTRKAGKEGGMAPSVYLFESFGAGKSPVADAPIYFEFVKNTGSLVQVVATDAYGKANTTIAKIDEPGKEAVIRAYPLFRARGKTYAFRSVFRDFAYLPPANVARVVALERSELGASDNPQVVDSAIATLKPAGLQLAPYNGKLAPDTFRLAFGGDAAALASLGADAPYTAFILVEASDLRQMELNGKKYNIFTSAATATFRLVRSDGTVVFALPLDPVKGQGGTREAAVSDGFRRAREALTPALQNSLQAIRDALAKE